MVELLLTALLYSTNNTTFKRNCAFTSLPSFTMSCTKIQTSGEEEGKEKFYTQVHGLPSIARLVRSAEEIPEPISTQVKGNIPTWIRGNFLRNGPGKFEFGNEQFNHWFDGMAMLHQFRIMDGQVTYRSRFLRSESYKQNSERDRIMVSEFGTVAMPDPCKNIFSRFLSRFELIKSTDNASVSFVKYKGDYYVSTETNFMHRVDPETLESVEKVDWSKFIAVNGATAHPHQDPDGTTYNMGNSYGPKGTFYNIISVPGEKESDSDTLQGARVLCSLTPTDSSRPSYYHSFAMSENYVVFIEQPIKMNVWKIVTAKLTGKGISDAIYWDPKVETIFHLIHKQTSQVSSVKYFTKPLATFHQINAFEQDGFLVLDLCASDDGQAIKVYNLQNMRKSGEALDQIYNRMCRVFPRRFVLPLNVTSETPLHQNLNTRQDSTATCVKTAEDKVFCTFENLHGDDLEGFGGLEFPVINYGRCNTKPYRFFYGCGFRHLVGDSLLKMDLDGKQLKSWSQPDLYPSEPVFVPAPDATEEDQGVIMSVVLSPEQDKGTFLLVLDAQTFQEVGRAEVPVNIPYGFHGTFQATG